MELVFLPATAPGDQTFGAVPPQIPSYPDATVRQVHYPSLVWYNRIVQEQAIAQIQSWGVDPVVLIGFSKSGLGAWNIARRIPDRVSATIIFDAPVARDALPPWGTAPFYSDDAAWQEDLPLRTCRPFQLAMPSHHRLVLISGANFHSEMCTLSNKLAGMGMEHVFQPRPEMKHHWNSGWPQEGLNDITGRSESSCLRA